MRGGLAAHRLASKARANELQRAIARMSGNYRRSYCIFARVRTCCNETARSRLIVEGARVPLPTSNGARGGWVVTGEREGGGLAPRRQGVKGPRQRDVARDIQQVWQTTAVRGTSWHVFLPLATRWRAAASSWMPPTPIKLRTARVYPIP